MSSKDKIKNKKIDLNKKFSFIFDGAGFPIEERCVGTLCVRAFCAQIFPFLSAPHTWYVGRSYKLNLGMSVCMFQTRKFGPSRIQMKHELDT